MTILTSKLILFMITIDKINDNLLYKFLQFIH